MKHASFWTGVDGQRICLDVFCRITHSQDGFAQTTRGIIGIIGIPRGIIGKIGNPIFEHFEISENYDVLSKLGLNKGFLGSSVVKKRVLYRI